MSAASALAREPVRNLDIEQWVQGRYGFVPHPLWIDHCRELFLDSVPGGTRRRWQNCPADKQLIIKEAFVYFGLLQE